MDLSNPFQKHPEIIARLPRLVRVYIANVIFGFILSAIFTGLLIVTNTANVGHLVFAVERGWLAAFMLFVFNGIVFSAVQFGVIIMSQSDKSDE